MSNETGQLDESLPRAEPDQPLRRDVRMLGYELGRILRSLSGQAAFERVEHVRALSRRRRAGEHQAEVELEALLRDLDGPALRDLIRALAVFFDLANIAEDRHRVRVLRRREREQHPHPRSESVGAAVESLREAGLSADAMQSMLDALRIELVFTAHPTEAKRRTVRAMLRRLREALIEIERTDLLPRERRRILATLQSDLAVLWETDALRPNRPSVLGEVRRNLFIVDSLWATAPELLGALRWALADAWPGRSFRVPTFLRFGSWIGGDRDGNPFVTADVTHQTLAMLRDRVVELHRGACTDLLDRLPLSDRYAPPSRDLARALTSARQRWPDVVARQARANPHEQYRAWLDVVRYRLEQSRSSARPSDVAYMHGEDLAADVELIAASLRASGHELFADTAVQAWLDRIAIFGLHLAKLDIREDSRRLNAAVAELMAAASVPGDYESLDEAGRRAALLDPPTPHAAQHVDPAGLSDATAETLRLFELLHDAVGEAGTRGPIGAFIISMTHQASDVLAPWWLARFVAARRGDATPARFPISPLLETIDDLKRGESILSDLLQLPAYADHVRDTGGVQICMIGYSDSTKDGGYLAANWQLYDAQRRLAQAARSRGTEIMFFHGRGGAIGRGGGPAARSILSLPPDTVRGRIRITEQGEVLAERYDDPEIALRHLEQVTWATLLVSAERHGAPPQPAWTAAMERASRASQAQYRALVAAPGFLEYFDRATPIATIETLPIGSRPSRRAGQRTLESLRAIPYTFAWTQNRHLITGYYGMGDALLDACDGDTARLREMYEHWPFFRAMIDNAELALAKADLDIAAQYARLAGDEVGPRIYAMLRDAHQRAASVVLACNGREHLLDATPWLQRSIRVRNRYVDPLNFIQIELMRRVRGEDNDGRTAPDDEAVGLEELQRLTVQAIAAGLRTTG